MADNISCDRESLRKAVGNDSQNSLQPQLEEHLATCAECRHELERLAGGLTWLAEVRKHLSSSRIPAYSSDQSAAKAQTGPGDVGQSSSERDEDQDAGDKLDFLEPLDDPTKLGRLGTYEIDSVIGRGGMGVVLKAFDAALNRHVAIKVLAAQLATSGSARKRFSREAQAAAAVVHEHVVAIHAVDNSNKLPFIVMPYIPGRSLQDRLDATGPLEVKEILRIGIQTASGLAAAHAQGLVHRDIKPANILLENGIERVLITDFGLARAVDDASQTQSGFIAGTPQYMAPEQARGEPVDHRADLFSLGSVLYTMCSGHPPFRAETTLAVLRRICEETPRSLRETNPDVPPWLQAVIAKLHARDPAQRFQSAAEVASLLEQYLAHLQQPLVHPMPSFHAPQPAPRLTIRAKFPRLGWKRAALWTVPVLLFGALSFAVLKTRAIDRADWIPRGRSSATSPVQPIVAMGAMGAMGGPGSMPGATPQPPNPLPRDQWAVWESDLSQADRDLEQLELEMASPVSRSMQLP